MQFLPSTGRLSARTRVVKDGHWFDGRPHSLVSATAADDVLGFVFFALVLMRISWLDLARISLSNGQSVHQSASSERCSQAILYCIVVIDAPSNIVEDNSACALSHSPDSDLIEVKRHRKAIIVWTPCCFNGVCQEKYDNFRYTSALFTFILSAQSLEVGANHCNFSFFDNRSCFIYENDCEDKGCFPYSAYSAETNLFQDRVGRKPLGSGESGGHGLVNSGVAASVSGQTLYTLNLSYNLQSVVRLSMDLSYNLQSVVRLSMNLTTTFSRWSVSQYLMNLSYNLQPVVSFSISYEPELQPSVCGQILSTLNLSSNLQPMVSFSISYEPELQPSVSGQTLYGPELQPSASGQTLYGLELQPSVSGQFLYGLELQPSVCGQILSTLNLSYNLQPVVSFSISYEPELQSSPGVSGQTLYGPELQPSASGQFLYGLELQPSASGQILYGPELQPSVSGQTLYGPELQPSASGQFLYSLPFSFP
ncbi:hypothetical protein RRG08_032342 [Elysia crispata]|uniref:Uncharacterized protein n=1 Tax=Elysia crispata TaxID=231223 RepID=A0AAE1A2Z4_9GAST|nr:hypothetical protein RRG08_032342 [Elysia crispata]